MHPVRGAFLPWCPGSLGETLINPTSITRAEVQHRVELNAWWRGLFAQFPYRPGHRLPGGVTHLQSFFRTPEQFIPGFHHPARVAVGQGACLQCEGIGWLLYADQQGVLGECECPVCAGTGSWPKAQRMAGSTTITYRETQRPPSPLPAATGVPTSAPRSPEPTAPAPRAPGPGSPGPAHAAGAEPRRRGVHGLVRALVAYPVFMILAYVVAQPIYAITHAPDFTSIVALLIGVAAATTLNQLIFGPLRDYQVLGPLWILVAPIYLVGGTIFLISIFTRSEMLSSLAFKVFTGAMSSREALSRVPLGR
jgi:hypothetical protein